MVEGIPGSLHSGAWVDLWLNAISTFLGEVSEVEASLPALTHEEVANPTVVVELGVLGEQLSTLLLELSELG